MLDIVGFKMAAWVCIGIYCAMLLFHLVLIFGAGVMTVIPTNIVWGGRLTSQSQLLRFEIIAMVVTGVFLFLTLIKAGFLEIALLYGFSHYAMWVLFAFFALNTLGNLMSPTVFEKSMSIPAALLSLATLRLVLEKI